MDMEDIKIFAKNKKKNCKSLFKLCSHDIRKEIGIE